MIFDAVIRCSVQFGYDIRRQACNSGGDFVVPLQFTYDIRSA